MSQTKKPSDLQKPDEFPREVYSKLASLRTQSRAKPYKPEPADLGIDLLPGSPMEGNHLSCIDDLVRARLLSKASEALRCADLSSARDCLLEVGNLLGSNSSEFDKFSGDLFRTLLAATECGDLTFAPSPSVSSASV